MNDKVCLSICFDSKWVFEDSGIHSAIVRQFEHRIIEKWPHDISILTSSINESHILYSGSMSVNSIKDALFKVVESLDVPNNASSICVLQDDSTEIAQDNDKVVECTEESDDQLALQINKLFKEQLEEQTQHDSCNLGVSSNTKASQDDITHSTEITNEEECDGIDNTKSSGRLLNAGPCSALSQIDSMVACRDFKQLAHDISNSAQCFLKDGTLPLFFSEVYLLSADMGSGIHFSLSLFSLLLKETGLTNNKLKVEWINLPDFSDREMALKMQKTDSMLRNLLDGNNLLCIEIANWLGHTHMSEFKKILLTIFRNNSKCIVVFRIPYVKTSLLNQTLSDISDLISVRPVVYEPFSHLELRELASLYLSKFDFSLTSDAWNYFDNRMDEEKSDGYFYGTHTVQKVIGSIIRRKEYICPPDKMQDKIISAEVIDDLDFNKHSTLTDPLKKLQSMIGMQGIAAKIEEIVNQIIYSHNNNIQSKPTMHMCFVGNPGTGKTTVARILGEILKEKGILRIGKFFEHHGRDLCGEYVGQTAPKTREICQEAYGSVLFIDEAYSLASNDQRYDYGREAIDMLITEMENNKDDMIIILAGYPDDIQRLLDLNPGMRSRIPYTVNFSSYSNKELADMFIDMVIPDFSYSNDFEQHVREYFSNIPKEIIQDRRFGNGRFVRNLYERVWGKALSRSSNNGFGSIELTCADFDLAALEFDVLPSSKTNSRIGF